MAKMIPTTISSEIKSNAERKVFSWFKDCPNTEDWIVLHSLGVVNHRSVMYGEIDFLVLAPKYGIFSIEVKGGRVSRKNGVWTFTNKYNKVNTKGRGPFEQASEGIFSVFDAIKRRFGSSHRLSCLLFGYGVIFPDFIYNYDEFESERWQVHDHSDGENLENFIKKLSKQNKKKWIDTYGRFYDDKIPTNKDIRMLYNFLRKDFELVISLSKQVHDSELGLIKLTNEQANCLDQLEDNSRCLIEGVAGTGKTLLAIEEAKRAVMNGEKVAIICFNKFLGSWISEHFRALDSNLLPDFSGTFHALMLKHAKLLYPNLEVGEDNTFFTEDLPFMAIEAIEKNGIYYDKVIIDEAQDFIHIDYYDVLDSLIKNGIRRGKWSIFGDFYKQVIYNDKNQTNFKEYLEEKTGFVKFKLRKNCRNTNPIIQQIKIISGLNDSYMLENKVLGPPVNYYSYRNENEQKDKLENLIGKLLKQKIKRSDITLLSPFKWDKSVASSIDKYKLEKYQFVNSVDALLFSTIHSYKGLENSVIILLDIETISEEHLIYVGLSRAKVALHVFLTKSAKQEKDEITLRWFE
jgi:hypothetical protein